MTTVNRPRIIDGGLATGLEQRGHRLHPRLWSAGVFLDEPQAVEDLHLAYLEAGAEILITASYQMSFAGLEREGLDHREAAAAMRRTVGVARRAIERHGGEAQVAASIGPYGATLADGSEYRGRYQLGVAELRDFHRERLGVLAACGADLLALETIPSYEEAQALTSLLAEGDGPGAWLSFCCCDAETIADGTLIARAAHLADDCERIIAVGVNCTAPVHVSALIDAIRQGSSKPIVVYPNSGETWDAAARRWSGAAAGDRFVELAREWAAKGAWAIGGCCRVGPEVIRRLCAELSGDGPGSR